MGGSVVVSAVGGRIGDGADGGMDALATGARLGSTVGDEWPRDGPVERGSVATGY